MPEEEPIDWNNALWKKQHEIAEQLYYTNKLLRKLSRRSIFWPVCFAIILAPIVLFGIVLGLTLLPIFASGLAQTNQLRRAAERQQEAEASAAAAEEPDQREIDDDEAGLEALPDDWKPVGGG